MHHSPRSQLADAMDLVGSAVVDCFALIRSRREDFRDTSSVFLVLSVEAGHTNMEIGVCAFGTMGFTPDFGRDFIRVSFLYVGAGRIEWT